MPPVASPTNTADQLLAKAKAMQTQTQSEGAKAFAGSKYDTGNYSPTVVTDTTIRENVIPSLNSRVNSYSQPVQLTQPNDTLKSAGLKGSTPQDIEDAVNSDPSIIANNKLIESLRSNNDAQFNTQVDGIRRKYDQLVSNLQEQQKSQTSAINQSLLLGGSSQYAPISSSGILSAKTRYDIQSLSALASEEEGLISQARSARDQKDFQLVQQTIKMLDEKRKEKTDLVNEVNKSLSEQLLKTREKEIQSSRDGAIADLVSQGVTDPVTILNNLNYDENGNQIGDFTADEIGKTLKSIVKKNDLGSLEKLSGATRDYFILKENGALPGNIESLPENQQLAAYLKFIKPGKVAGVGKVNKITLSEARTNGLPLAVVGMSEDDVLNSFDSATPPKWFVEKAQNEEKRSLVPEYVQGLWNEYRNQVSDNFGGGAKTSVATDYTSRAEDYFKKSYGEDLDDETASTLADYVQQYVEGGMSYAKAVAKVEEEASK